jgi:hypothetical protein
MSTWLSFKDRFGLYLGQKCLRGLLGQGPIGGLLRRHFQQGVKNSTRNFSYYIFS